MAATPFITIAPEASSVTMTNSSAAPTTSHPSMSWPLIEQQQQHSASRVRELPSLLESWERLYQTVTRALSGFYQGFAQPVEVINDEVQIHQYAMIPEKPYVVSYQGELYEFTSKIDGSIEISELRIEK